MLLTVGGYGFRDRSIDRREEVATIRAALPTLRHVVHVPYGEHAVPDALSWDELLAEPGAARVRAGRLRPPAVRALLVGDDGPAEGDRPRARRHPARVPQGARVQLGPEAGRPPALVQHDLLDDVERARRGAPRAVVDRDARRRPDLAGPRLAVAGRRGDAPDLHGREPGLPDGVPQGGPGARARVRPQLDPRLRHRRLAAPGRGLPLRLRPARARRAADQRQRRHRRLQRDRRRLAAPPGLRGRDLRPPARRRGRRLRPAGRAARRRAGRARDHQADAVDARRAVGRHGRLPLPQLVLRACSRGSGARATGSCSRSAAAASSRAARTRPSTAAASASAPASSTASSRSCRRSRTASSSTSRTTRAARASSCCSSCSPTASRWTTSCARSIGRSLRSQLSPRHVPDTIRAVPAIPRTLTGKKLEAPVKRILRGDAVDAGREPRLAPRPDGARRVRRDRGRGAGRLARR